MPTARKYQISLSDTPYYHCISRCVRRAFLCGEDNYTGKSYEHRKQWVTDKLSELSQVFSIEICAYAIMSNHTHMVLKINQTQAKDWTQDEVILRWCQLFSGNVLIQRYLKGVCHTQAELNKVKEISQIWRDRLSSISWFMRCLNESIARQANTEDNCSGRFWEGRFKSQALLNEQALLACMVYVDLNPIRAGLSDNLEESAYTSIAQRIKEFNQQKIQEKSLKKPEHIQLPKQIIKLAPLINPKKSQASIHFTLKDYFELAQWTGKAKREDIKGFISSTQPQIIHKLAINQATWLETVNSFTEQFYTFIGDKDKLKTICQQQDKKWLRGYKLCQRLFN